MKLNLDYLLEVLWEYLALIRVYTKKRGGTSMSKYKRPILKSDIFQPKKLTF